jgi:hypothetical protein
LQSETERKAQKGHCNGSGPQAEPARPFSFDIGSCEFQTVSPFDPSAVFSSAAVDVFLFGLSLRAEVNTAFKSLKFCFFSSRF